MLLLELDLLLYDLFLARLVAVLMAARVLALVPASAADAWTRHYTNYSSAVKPYIVVSLTWHFHVSSIFLVYGLNFFKTLYF